MKNEFKYEQNLEIDFSPKAMQLVTNRNLLHQIFVIVISNSLKFCPNPCKIHLGSRQEKHKTVLEITDNGTGFAPEIIPHIFDRFYRTDVSRNSSKGGSGIGLSIAKKIIEDHGGSIWASSEPGEGLSQHFILRKIE